MRVTRRLLLKGAVIRPTESFECRWEKSLDLPECVLLHAVNAVPNGNASGVVVLRELVLCLTEQDTFAIVADGVLLFVAEFDHAFDSLHAAHSGSV